LCVVQSDKATVDIPSRYAGAVVKLHAREGDVVQVGANLLDIALVADATDDDEGSSGSFDVGVDDRPSTNKSSSGTDAYSNAEDGASLTAAVQVAPVLATPAVRALAREHGLDLAQLAPGRGKGGRVLKEDVLQFLQHGHDDAAAYGPSGQQQQPPQGMEEVQRVPIRGYARAMVGAMTAANSVPHFLFCDDVDVGALNTLRRQLNASQETRYTMLPFLVKMLSQTLLHFPQANATLAPGLDELLLHRAHNVGVAMATPRGLVVPNVKNVQRLSIQEVHAELGRLREKALSGTLPAEDLAGGTITISNIGAIGGTYAAPLLKLPEVAIVALGKSQKLPRFDDHGNVFAAELMSVSWAADHRVLDGALVASMSNRWKSLIEQPQAMMVDMR